MVTNVAAMTAMIAAAVLHAIRPIKRASIKGDVIPMNAKMQMMIIIMEIFVQPLRVIPIVVALIIMTAVQVLSARVIFA